MMKKLLCAALICGLLIAAAAAESPLFTSGVTEQKLGAMIPVLDSLALCLDVAAEGGDSAAPVYDAADDALVWSQLRLMASNWLSRDPAYRERDGAAVSVPAEVMDACAAASFQGLIMAPVLPDTATGADLVYDEIDDAYRMDLGEDDGHTLVIERNAQDGETMVVNCGLYDGDTGARVGGLTARMAPAAEEALYPYAVTEAHIEGAEDFNGLWTNYCDIRYVEPEPAAPSEILETEGEADEAEEPGTGWQPDADAAPSGVAYRRLAQGSRDEDVRALQERLKELGYECGVADGIYGNNTSSAVRNFQAAIGVEQDGVATASVQQKLFSASAPKYEKYLKLKKGDQGIHVEALQNRLLELGYTGHPADGNYDSRIADAVERFQNTVGLKETGVADADTQEALFDKNAPECPGFVDLEKDDIGDRVKQMQKQLKHLRYLSKVTGKYDSKTVTAVGKFKDKYKLSGGGNSASASDIAAMFNARRDSKSTPKPTATPTVAPTTAPTTAPTAAPTVAPQEPVSEPEQEQEPASEPEPEPQPEQQSEPEPQPETQSQPESQSEPEPQSDPEPQPEPQAETQYDVVN